MAKTGRRMQSSRQAHAAQPRPAGADHLDLGLIAQADMAVDDDRGARGQALGDLDHAVAALAGVTGVSTARPSSTR